MTKPANCSMISPWRRVFTYICITVLCLTLALSLSAPALAAGTDMYIFDTVGCLSQEEYNSLEQTAADLSAQYSCGVYAVIVEDYTEYGSDLRSAAKAIYEGSSFGWGESRDGIQLLLSMKDRDYNIFTSGFGNTAVTDFGADYLAEQFSDGFRENNWYAGLQSYYETTAFLLESASNGEPIDTGSNLEGGGVNPFWFLIIGIAVPLIAAHVYCSSLKRSMTVVSEAARADFFMAPNSLKLTESRDEFSHITETRVRVENDKDRDGGGTSVGSDGYASHSGKF